VNARLLIRDRPREDENMAEYLRRVADLNGYPNAPGFFRDVSDHDSPTLKDIADLVRIDIKALQRLPEPWPSWVSQRKPSRQKGEASPIWLNRATIRWCPSCLTEDAYMRAPWSFKLIVACPRHRQMLRQSCDTCGTVFQWKAAPFARCRCGRALAEMGADPADQALIDMMRLCQAEPVARKTAGQGVNPGDSLERLAPPSVLRLLHASAPLVPGYAKSVPGSFPGLHDLAHAVRYVKACANLLLSWPSGFRQLLQQYVDDVPVETSIRRRYGALHRVLYKNLPGREFDFMRREFERHLDGHWYGPIDGRHSVFRQQQKHPIMSGKAMRAQIGCSRETLRRLIEGGTLEGHLLHSPSGRTFPVADRRSVRLARIELDNLVTLRVASQELSLSQRRIRILIGAGLIGSKEHRNNGNGKWAIPKTEINRLLGLPVLLRDDLDPDAAWTLAHVLRHRCRDHATFIEFMRALLTGSIRSVGRASGMVGMAAFLLSKADVELAIADASCLPADGMTAQLLAQRLQVKEEVAYQLIRSGLLKSYDHHLNGRAIRLVTESALQEFQENYRPLVDFAKCRRTSPKAAYTWLSKQGFHPVTGPAVDGLRQYFYRSTDIATAVRWSVTASYSDKVI
jgi:hypothetical protein